MTGKLRRYIALILLLIISMVIVPREFFHALYDHEDTPHNVCENHTKGVHVEQQHHHCEFLKFQVPPYFVSFSNVELTAEVTRIDFQSFVTCCFSGKSYNLSPLRGPPSLLG